MNEMKTVPESPEVSRILVVEDGRLLAISLKLQLQALGYEVVATTGSGEDAIVQVGALRPDLVLMDIHLAGAMDGVEAAAEIRRRFRLPVIYLTAYSNPEVLARAKVTGPHGYILKPFEQRELHVVIEMALYRHRMEQALEERERWLDATLDSIGDGVIATDGGGHVRFLNPVARHLTGWTADEAAGRPVEEIVALVDGETRAVVPNPVRVAMRERRKVPLCDRALLRDRNGVERPIDDCAAPIFDRHGELLGGVIIVHDATGRKKAEARLRHAQKMEAVGRLAGGIAHDFNNLLTIINGYSHLVRQMVPAEGRVREMLSEVVKAGERAAGLTRQLLAFGRRQVLQPKIFDLNAMISDLEEILKRVIGEEIELVTSLRPGLGPVKADPGQVEQVLMNLAIHARDAMPRGGRLTFETAEVELGRDDFREAESEGRAGPYARLTVRDTGTGMDEATRARIFEPFFRADGKGLADGAGLGLASTYGIVAQSGGRIRVDSAPGSGTTFTIDLPRDRDETVPTSAPAAEAPRARVGETVLLVEDEPALRDLARTTLLAAGYRVLEASQGEEALERVSRHSGPIDLLVTDMAMPRMGGRPLADAVRRIHPQVRVLFISGSNEEGPSERDMESAACSFLRKPFRMNDLVEAVRSAKPLAG